MLDGQWEDPFGIVGTPRQGVPDPQAPPFHAAQPGERPPFAAPRTERVQMRRAGAPALAVVRLSAADPLERERAVWGL